MREFFELVATRLRPLKDQYILRGPELHIIEETARFWAKMNLVEDVTIFHVRDECSGREEGRIKIFTASRAGKRLNDWVTISSAGGEAIAWKLD